MLQHAQLRSPCLCIHPLRLQTRFSEVRQSQGCCCCHSVRHVLLQAMQEAPRAPYSRQQSLVVDRLVDNLAVEAAVSYGGTRKPAAAHALKMQLHKAAQRLPSLAAASSQPRVSKPEEVVVTISEIVISADGDDRMGVVAADADADMTAQPLSTVPEVSCRLSVNMQCLPRYLATLMAALVTCCL